MNPAIPGIAGLVLYALSTGAVFMRLWQQGSTSKQLLAGLGGVALLQHSLVFVALAVSDGQLDLSFYDALSLVGCLVILLMLFGLMFRPISNLGIVLFPAAGTTLLLQLIFGDQHQQLADYGWQIDLHIALAVFAYAILSIAAAQAMVLAIQERALRGGHLQGPLSVLPPLPAMESLLFQLITVGFGLLTLTLLSGLVFVDDLMAQHLAHKTILSIAGWLVFGGLLLGRWRFGWRGRTAIRLTLAGMAVLLLAYFGSKLVLELILNRN